jgi:hypothetical protein
LDIKYDNYYSDESAQATEASLDHAVDGQYPKGAKILKSRCADVDKEEVYISPLTTHLSSTEMFRLREGRRVPDPEAAEQAGPSSSRSPAAQRASPSGSYLENLKLDKVVDGDRSSDSDNVFVHGQCSVYQGPLYKEPKRRNRNSGPRAYLSQKRR